MALLATVREQGLFCHCLDLPPEQRSSWLETVCGADEPLRHRIERLLIAHETAEAAAVQESPAPLPDSIGDYRIVRLIGEGGMGVVYEALQEQPVHRRVALKAVKLGMDTREVISRFRTERQALAALDHPYVAKVFDAGQTETGRPFFVMEYVEGIPLLDYCNERRLAVADRISIFIGVCQAVQHAHQKGVIHRDLKPGNILVASEFEKPMPKIIDFGIARAVSPAPEFYATRTSVGSGPGTPAYMSPEQAGYRGLDIDTRSDVYSLGVVLYELLTGRLPLEAGGDLRQLLASGDASVAAPGVSTDLDAIVLKALETDRERRYQTATAFADDLHRFLERRPVTARTPTLRYRASKYVRRHRAQVLAAAVATTAILIGATAGAVGLVRARTAEAAAKEQAATAQQISKFLVSLFTTADPNRVPGSPVTVRQVLEEGTRRVEAELSGLPGTQAALLGTLSHVHDSVGSYRQARDLAKRALALRPGVEDTEMAGTLVSLARASHRLGEFNEARSAVQRAIEIRVRLLGEEHLEVSQALNILGGIEGQVERFAEAESAHRRALAIQEKVKGPDDIATYNSWRGLGIIYGRQGRNAEALKCFEQIVPIAKKRYGDSHPVVADAIQNVANELTDLGRLAEAESMYLHVLAMRRKLFGGNHPDIAFTDAGLAIVYEKQGRLKDAVPYLEDAVRIRAAALGADNVRTNASVKSLALARIALGQPDQGHRLLVRALQAMEKAYGPNHTSVLQGHRDAAFALVKAGRHELAVPHVRRVNSSGSEKMRIDLNDPLFRKMRSTLAFRQLRDAA